jgi:hypothetical protein
VWTTLGLWLLVQLASASLSTSAFAAELPLLIIIAFAALASGAAVGAVSVPGLRGYGARLIDIAFVAVAGTVPLVTVLALSPSRVDSAAGGAGISIWPLAAMALCGMALLRWLAQKKARASPSAVRGIPSVIFVAAPTVLVSTLAALAFWRFSGDLRAGADAGWTLLVPAAFSSAATSLLIERKAGTLLPPLGLYEQSSERARMIGRTLPIASMAMLALLASLCVVSGVLRSEPRAEKVALDTRAQTVPLPHSGLTIAAEKGTPVSVELKSEGQIDLVLLIRNGDEPLRADDPEQLAFTTSTGQFQVCAYEFRAESIISSVDVCSSVQPPLLLGEWLGSLFGSRKPVGQLVIAERRPSAGTRLINLDESGLAESFTTTALAMLDASFITDGKSDAVLILENDDGDVLAVGDDPEIITRLLPPGRYNLCGRVYGAQPTCSRDTSIPVAGELALTTTVLNPAPLSQRTLESELSQRSGTVTGVIDLSGGQVYAFSLASPARLAAAFEGSDGPDVDEVLILEHSDGETVAVGDDPEVLSQPLPPGRYRLCARNLRCR